MAERLGLAAAAALFQRPVARGPSARLLFAHLAGKLPDLRPQGAVIVDHCGLDAANRLTAWQLATLLREGWRRFDLAALLPLSAWSGTLERRFKRPSLALAVAAKSGTLDYARALAGYLLIGGRPQIVVLMADDLRARRDYRRQRPPTAAARSHLAGWQEAARQREERFLEALMTSR